MPLYNLASTSRLPQAPARTTEFDVLKASHQFLRNEDEDALAEAGDEREGKGGPSWEDRVARKYYDSLYREFAVCDLKHYKSGNFALRWRTESEVLSGSGESTCGNTRCFLHHASSFSPAGIMDDEDDEDSATLRKRRGLKTVELPFAYEEHGEPKAALVKVVLCGGCLKKLMWKREREKEEKEQDEEKRRDANVEKSTRKEKDGKDEDGRERRRRAAVARIGEDGRERRRRSSRSASPSRRRHKHRV